MPAARERTVAPGEEEAGAELILGEFQGVPTLSVSEAKMVIDTLVTRRKNRDPNGFRETETLSKMQEYMDTFSRFKDKEALIEAAGWLEDYSAKLDSFERSQLLTLTCEGVDEAKTLIPSLVGKISDEELEGIIKEIHKYRDFSG
ncbi:RNA polymerase Rpb4 [Eremomyces bilateralis CBS 781.70]|uniref:RNA polymerase Rpb4 n=1 Tax=Eremomyces bilateralis CBS 781.70 TaxID=1392243 RepID=A0A6G1G050_9PEZI|nr:RNA polymerase Rpb4 [Eremomyces bilateralis CBS 781.70]KAF1811352.1 RNA polymerase Rpb4 [Eremomyces bilateralis CBS 781.70]